MIILILNKMPTNRKTYLVVAALMLGFFIFCSLAQGLEEEREMKDKLDNPFGVLEFLHWNHDWNSYKYPGKRELEDAAKLMKEAGVGIVRVDFLWSDIEPDKEKFDFKKYDTIVEIMGKHNIEILGILDYSADWASNCMAWNCPPKNNQLFIDYASQVVERYKGKVTYWELWNEPDSSTYWRDQDGLKGYCGLLKETYLALKKVNPQCKILNGGLANGASSVNKLYDNGAKDYFDIMNIHIFQTPIHKNAIKAVIAYAKLTYKIMQRNGDRDKKIWVTEIGCPGVKRGQKADNWWMGKNPDEQQQALWVKEVFSELLKQQAVEKVFWAFLRDCNKHWSNGVDYFGLIRWDFSKKPSFRAYQKCFNNWKKSK